MGPKKGFTGRTLILRGDERGVGHLEMSAVAIGHAESHLKPGKISRNPGTILYKILGFSTKIRLS